MINEKFFYYILIITNIIFLSIGYIIGKINSQGSTQSQPKKHINTDTNEIIESLVKIDDAKYVTNINTKGLEKKYESLGQVKQSDENINTAINKLKNLKGE